MTTCLVFNQLINVCIFIIPIHIHITRIEQINFICCLFLQMQSSGVTKICTAFHRVAALPAGVEHSCDFHQGAFTLKKNSSQNVSSVQLFISQRKQIYFFHMCIKAPTTHTLEYFSLAFPKFRINVSSVFTNIRKLRNLSWKP